MKRVLIFALFFSLSGLTEVKSQEFTNFISCTVDSTIFKAEARRLQLPISGFNYLAFGAFKINPDIQVWLRFYYYFDELKPGTYQIVSENDINKNTKRSSEENIVWVMVDYTEETSKLGHGFHDGESLSGTVTITKITDTSIEGNFEATLSGVYYKKKGMATISGRGLEANIKRKIITNAGGGMIAHTDPHHHPDTRKMKETDTIILSDGKFSIDWTKK